MGLVQPASHGLAHLLAISRFKHEHYHRQTLPVLYRLDTIFIPPQRPTYLNTQSARLPQNSMKKVVLVLCFYMSGGKEYRCLHPLKFTYAGKEPHCCLYKQGSILAKVTDANIDTTMELAIR